MTAARSQENQKVCVDLAKSDTNNLKSSAYRLAAKNTLERWLGADLIDAFGYEMPRRLDWALFKRIYPVKYSFAHGGKDGVPYQVARKDYDESIRYLYGAIEGAEIERVERRSTLKKLADFS